MGGIEPGVYLASVFWGGKWNPPEEVKVFMGNGIKGHRPKMEMPLFEYAGHRIWATSLRIIKRLK